MKKKKKRKCSCGNKPLSQKFLLEGNGEREGGEVRQVVGRRKRWREGRERRGGSERVIEVPRKPRNTQPCLSLRSPWEAFTTPTAWTEPPVVIYWIWGCSPNTVLFLKLNR